MTIYKDNYMPTNIEFIETEGEQVVPAGCRDSKSRGSRCSRCTCQYTKLPSLEDYMRDAPKQAICIGAGGGYKGRTENDHE